LQAFSLSALFGFQIYEGYVVSFFHGVGRAADFYGDGIFGDGYFG
jgi:hypothetical protein